jgi:cytoskeletal protein CcmA (bactofilin family)
MSSLFSARKQPPSESTSFPPPPPHETARQPVGFETILGAGATLHGDLRSQGNVRLDGTFEGTLEIDGNVLVGETAKITADIHAKNVSIAGAVRGDVSGKKVQLLRTARVWGDITASAISTEEGAFIDGKITMVTHEAAQPLDLASVPLPAGDMLAEPSAASRESGEAAQAEADLPPAGS